MITTNSYRVVGGDYSCRNFIQRNCLKSKVPTDPVLAPYASRAIEHIVGNIDALRDMLREDGPPVIINGRAFPNSDHGAGQFSGVIALATNSEGNVLYAYREGIVDYLAECCPIRITLDESLHTTANDMGTPDRKKVEALQEIVEKECHAPVDSILVEELLRIHESIPNSELVGSVQR